MGCPPVLVHATAKRAAFEAVRYYKLAASTRGVESWHYRQIMRRTANDWCAHAREKHDEVAKRQAR
jgi:hypothetical protein